MCQTMWGWKMRAATAARRTATKRVRMAGIFLAISTPVMSGTIRSQRFMSKAEARSEENSVIVPCEFTSWVKLTIRNMTRAMANEGMVVMSI